MLTDNKIAKAAKAGGARAASNVAKMAYAEGAWDAVDLLENPFVDCPEENSQYLGDILHCASQFLSKRLKARGIERK